MARLDPTHLPQLVSIKDDEAPVSYLARLAWANGFENAVQFCKITGLNGSKILNVPQEYAAQLSEWSTVPAPSLQNFALLPGVVIPFGRDLVKRSQLQTVGQRYCAKCLMNDRARGSSSQYLRGPWMWRMISHCPDHGDLLALNRNGVEPRHTFDDLVDPHSIDDPSPAHASDRYFWDRLIGRRGDSFLDQVPAYVAAEFCALIGQFELAMRVNTLTERIEGGFENPTVRRKGYEIACQGRQVTWDFLTEYVAYTSKRVTFPRRIYSPFLHWWQVNKHNPHYTPMMKFFQEHAEENVALEPGDAFVYPITKRKVFTLATASREYNISQERIQRLLEEKLDTAELPRFFKRDHIHHWMLDATSYVTTSEAAAAIGCSLKVCDDLIKADLLSAVPNRQYDGRVYRLVHKFEIENFMRRLAAVVDRDLSLIGLTPIGAVHRASKVKIFEIIQLALAGEIARIGHSGGSLDISGLYFDREELWRLRNQKLDTDEKAFDAELIDLVAARRRLRVTKSTIDELVERAIIPSREMENEGNWKGRTRKWVDTADLDRFDLEHISLDELAAKHQIERMKMWEQLARSGVRPIFEASRMGGRFYKKADVEALDSVIAP